MVQERDCIWNRWGTMILAPLSDRLLVAYRRAYEAEKWKYKDEDDNGSEISDETVGAFDETHVGRPLEVQLELEV